MQQFFGLVNALLAANPAAAKRRLGMTTYKASASTPSYEHWRLSPTSHPQYLLVPSDLASLNRTARQAMHRDQCSALVRCGTQHMLRSPGMPRSLRCCEAA